MLKKIIFLLVCCLISSFAALAKEPPPKSSKLVNDYVGLLAQDEVQRLERKLKHYSDSTSTQIAIVIEASLDGDNAADYAYSIGRAWGVGEKGKNNGVLIFVARDDRKIFIATGYGVEGFLPDATAKSIVDNIIKPAFKQQQYYKGLNSATDAIFGKGKGEFKNDRHKSEADDEELTTGDIIMLILVFFVIIFIFTRIFKGDNDRGYSRRGRYQDHRSGGGGVWWIGGGGGGGGFDSDSGGGGGNDDFGGFGGGDFGGGGAGGDW